MQAYATAEMAPSAELRVLDERRAGPDARGEIAASRTELLDDLVAQIADLVAERIATKLLTPPTEAGVEWLDSRHAAEYLGIHRDSLRRLAAEGAIPVEQAGVGCKLYFRRSDLDRWRCPGSSPVVAIRGLRHA